MRTVFIPLDDRPCCWQFPVRLAQMAGESLILPPDYIWRGESKRSKDSLNSDWPYLLSWLDAVKRSEGNKDTAFLASADMICFGGLAASRCPGALKGAEKILRRALKKMQGDTYLFASVMRTAPTQKSAAEVAQAEYLVKSGFEISRNFAGKLCLSADKLADLFYSPESPLKDLVTAEITKSEIVSRSFWLRYYNYRRTKHLLNRSLIKLRKAAESKKRRKNGYLAFCIDDTKSSGFNIWEAEELSCRLRGRTDSSVSAGTDETAALLLARRFGGGRVRCVWSDIGSSRIITRYENKCLADLLQAQAQWADIEIFSDSDVSLPELWIYAPYKEQQEAVFQNKYVSLCDLPDERLKAWLNDMKESAAAGHRIFVADLAYANGGSAKLVSYLKESGLLSLIYGYSAWNTAGNALGTALACALISCKSQNNALLCRRFLLERLLDDFYYQSAVRPELSRKIGGAFIFMHDEALKDMELQIENRLKKYFYEELAGFFEDLPLKNISVKLPWGRLFEIEANAELRHL